MKFFTLSMLLLVSYSSIDIIAMDFANQAQAESNTQDPTISRDEFAAISKFASCITKKYSERDFLYLGVGRSPTAIIAYLQNQLGDDKAKNVPISKFKATDKCRDVSSIPPCYQPPFGNTKFYQTTQYFYYAPLTEQETALLYAHFDRFLLSFIGTKNIVLIDLGYRGDTLCSMKEVLQKYFMDQKINNKIILFAMVQIDDMVNIDKRAEWAGYEIDSIFLDDNCPFTEKLRNHGYDQYGEYGEFIIRHTDATKVTKPQSLEPREAYNKFKQTLLIHQKKSTSDF